MTKEQIIRMAHKAGMLVVTSRDSLDQLERFAALVAAAEREACAKECDDDKIQSGEWTPEELPSLENVVKQTLLYYGAIIISRNVVQNAIEALEGCYGRNTADGVKRTRSIRELRESLNDHQASFDSGITNCETASCVANSECKAFQSKMWVGLTKDELDFYERELGLGELGRGVIRAAIEHVKEKNQ